MSRATAQPLTAPPPIVEPIPSVATPALPSPAAETLPEEAASVEQPAEAEPEPVPSLNDVAAAGTVPPPKPPFAAPAPAPSFDWESLIGVKLFAGIAGVALVLAAVFFLRYSIDQGWLQPPVRVAIGVLVSVVLLVLCELKAAREYPATANALDGAAIAILFATFFAAHTLWNLIPAAATFVLLAIVTALAVLLSIRRESLFIAVLGLLGGFATPALVSTGENRPIPLFAYLLLLNVGLAWVAYRKVWPVLTWLTLGLTTLYQLVWVARFLEESSLSIAMGIFLVFPLAAAVGLTIAGPRGDGKGDRTARSFERTAMLSAGVPLIFAGYLASVPAYGAHAALLLGFLLIVDAGLLAISIARGQALLHAVGGLTTLVVLAVWLATSYVPGEGWTAGLVCTAGFVVLYLGALPLARWFGRPFSSGPVRTGSCRLTRAVRLPGPGRDRAGVHTAGAALRDPAGARSAHGLAGGNGVGRHAVLRRGLFCDCSASGLVGPLPHRGPAAGRGGALHDLRDRLHGCACARATSWQTVRARLGQRDRPPYQLGSAGVRIAWPRQFRGVVGAGAAAGNHERGALHRERVRRVAEDLPNRVAPVVGSARALVATRRRKRGSPAFAHRHVRSHTHHPCRARVGRPPRSWRRRPGSVRGAVLTGPVSGARWPSVSPADCRQP